MILSLHNLAQPEPNRFQTGPTKLNLCVPMPIDAAKQGHQVGVHFKHKLGSFAGVGRQGPNPGDGNRKNSCQNGSRFSDLVTEPLPASFNISPPR